MGCFNSKANVEAKPITEVAMSEAPRGV
jgi:hypothetical protein